MSYDVRLEDQDGNYVAEVGNYTANVEEIWELALGFPIRECQRQKARLVDISLRKGITRLRTPRFRPAFVALEPSNGWGSTDRAADFLEKLADTCKKHPNAIVVLRY